MSDSNSAGGLRRILKHATQPLHDQVEATNLMGGLMRDNLTAANYAGTLGALHSIYAPLEAELRRVPDLTDWLPDLERRMKTASLARDLAALGEDSVGKTPPLSVQPITTAAEALGTMYVLEGSTMGGRIIANTLKSRPFVTKECLNFFTYYGSEANVFWQKFVATLDRVPRDQHDAVRIAAEQTFRYFIAAAE